MEKSRKYQGEIKERSRRDQGEIKERSRRNEKIKDGSRMDKREVKLSKR